VLRRIGTPGPEGTRPRTESHGALSIDRAGLLVSLHGDPVPLAPSELRLLLTLSASPGQVLSRQQLLEAVWEHSYHGDIRLVDACVKRLRAKLGGPDPAASGPGPGQASAGAEYIETVRGFGYRFRTP
jgi:DNA-binding response OmpR family regulator